MIKKILSIRPGAVVQEGGQQYCIRRMLSLDDVEVLSVETGKIFVKRIAELDEATMLLEPSSRLDLIALDEHDWESALSRFRIVAPLLQLKNRTKDDVLHAARSAAVNPATIYRWIKRLEATGSVSALIRKSRDDEGKSRIDDESESIMKAVILDAFLKDQALSATRAYRELLRRCRVSQVTAPHISTFRRRIQELTPVTVAAAREGKKAARRFHPLRGTFPGGESPYAVLQIDHTTVDVILVDETHRLPISRPYITVAIDIYSRMIAGYFISLDSPGTLGTALCIANAILPKEKRLQELGVSYPWPCRGLPAVIYVDNAKEFRGNTLRMACQEYGIDLEFRPVKQPNYGGHIERLMGTLMREIHALPGTTRSSAADLGEYDPERQAAMTLKEFEAWFANMVLGAYHHRVHSDLMLPPIVKYEQGILGNDQEPGTGYPPLPVDETKLRTDFLPYELRTIQPYGIAWDGIFYQADVLSRWIGSKDPNSVRAKRKFIVRRDPRDISSILFFDPEVRQHFRIPYQNPRFPVISLWELRAVQRFLKEKGRQAENQDVIFAAFDEMQRIECLAREETKRTRIQRAKRTERQRSVKKQSIGEELTPTISTVGEQLDFGEVRPFDDIEEL